MWVLKAHGDTYYVNHVDCTLPWSTKETSDNPHTKGSIKVKDCLLTIDSDNRATLSKLTLIDRVRLRNQRLGITRVIFRDNDFEKVLKEEGIKFSPFKRVTGACYTTYTVCDILDRHDAMILSLKYPGRFRVLQPNETYYQAYDDKKLWDKLQRESYEYD